MKSLLLNIINLIIDYTWNRRPDSIQSISENLSSLETPPAQLGTNCNFYKLYRSTRMHSKESFVKL